MKIKNLITLSTLICLLGFVIKEFLQKPTPCSEFFLIAGTVTNASLILIGGEHSKGKYRNGPEVETCLEHLTSNYSTHVILIEAYAADTQIRCETVQTADKPGRICAGAEDPETLSKYEPGRNAVENLQRMYTMQRLARNNVELDKLLAFTTAYFNQNQTTTNYSDRKLINDMIELRKKNYDAKTIFEMISETLKKETSDYLSSNTEMMRERNRGMATQFFKYRNNFTVVPIGLAHVYPNVLDGQHRESAQELLDTLEQRKEEQPYAVLGYKSYLGK